MPRKPKPAAREPGWYEDPDQVSAAVRPFLDEYFFGHCPHSDDVAGRRPNEHAMRKPPSDCHVCKDALLLNALERLNEITLASERAAKVYAGGLDPKQRR